MNLIQHLTWDNILFASLALIFVLGSCSLIVLNIIKWRNFTKGKEIEKTVQKNRQSNSKPRRNDTVDISKTRRTRNSKTKPK